MTRKEYLIFQFSGATSLFLFGCRDKNETIAPSKPEPVKILNFTKVIPEKAVEGKTIQVFWETENINSVVIYERINNLPWKLIAKDIDPRIGNFEIQLPSSFDFNSLYAIKITGEGIERIKDNIVTEKVYLTPTIEIINIEPKEAIAEERLKVFFKTEHLQNVLVELKNNRGDFLEAKTIDAKLGNFEFILPNQFVADEKLSINISGNSTFDLFENIPTFNIIKINTIDYPELKTVNGIRKIDTPKGDVWFKRVSTNEMKAFSGLCTHAGCGINYDTNDNVFNCSCHGSKFSAEGTVINGPANLPLNQFKCLHVSNEEFRLIY